MGNGKNIMIPVLDDERKQCVLVPLVTGQRCPLQHMAKIQSSFEPSVVYDEERQMCMLPEGIIAGEWYNAITASSVVPEGISFGENANMAVISAYSFSLIAAIMKDSDNPTITITSTRRTPEDQARAMYQGIKSKGLDYSYRLYGSAGDQVTKVAEDAMKKKWTAKKVMEAMEKEIIRVGPGNVSKHLGDFSKLNVIDIDPSSIVNQKNFAKEVLKRNIFLLKPPADRAFHLEIKQPHK
ncbi:MAG: hypothetical protein QM802_03465 [Agriterribacter sp.]